MRLKELGDGCLRVPSDLQDVEVTGLTCDSRCVKPGWAFVAVDGECVDGHRFVRRAVSAGASIVVGERPRQRRANGVGDAVDRTIRSLRVPYLRVADSRAALGYLSSNFYGRAHEKVRVVGVTGTKGKTTTAWLLDAIFRASGVVSGLLGTVHNRIGGSVRSARNTTPSSLELHRYLYELVRSGGTHAVMEVSSHGIAQRRTAGLEFDAAVFTNIAPEHLDYHGTFEDYLATKVKLFETLRPDAYAILPRDEDASARIQRATPARVVWFSDRPDDGVEDIRSGIGGTSFLWKGRRVETPLVGAHNLLNLLGAMTAAECIGIAPDTIAQAARAAAAPPGRLEEIPSGRGFRVFVDYAHTDGSLEAVLRALRPLTPGRIITVFGCGGDRDRGKRPRMGQVAEKGSDHLVVTSDNPRSEDPEAILDDIRAGLERPDETVFEPDRRAAIALGIRMARPHDAVLLAGKGHETYQEIQGERTHFDDREVAREFLAELSVGIETV